jgi:hypothetical protein
VGSLDGYGVILILQNAFNPKEFLTVNLDHVVPRARVGCNSYRNLVSSCMKCNSQKGERPAEEFLRWLFRERRLTAAELSDRFRALELLASGKLRPTLPSQGEERGPEN